MTTVTATRRITIDELPQRDAIRVLRALLDMTRRDVAVAWGVSTSTYDRVERGEKGASVAQFEWLVAQAVRAGLVHEDDEQCAG